MEIKPFRCVYDPELSRSKSQGNKPIILKPKPDQPTHDPRIGKTRSVGRRVVPTAELPLPEFAEKLVKPPPRRCLITGVSPLVSRSRLLDTITPFGSIEDCQICMSQTTGASLGIAWVVFANSAPRAARSLVEQCKQGTLMLESSGKPLCVKIDDDGKLLREAELAAEKYMQSQFSEARASSRAPQSGKQDLTPLTSSDLQRVELRPLTPAQVTMWYDKFLGTDPTYILIRDIYLPVKRYTSGDIERIFRAFPYSQVVANKSGFYICFSNPDDAIDCFLQMNRKPIDGTLVKLLITVAGVRYKRDEVPALKMQREHERQLPNQQRGTSVSTNLSMYSKTLRPGQMSQHQAAIDESAHRILSELGPQLKKAAWRSFLSGFVTQIIERELVKKREPHQHQQFKNGEASLSEESKDTSPGTPSTPGPGDSDQTSVHQPVGFGARRGGAIGMTARAVSGYGVVRPWSSLQELKIRKRPPAQAPLQNTPKIKKRKQFQVKATPHSFIRAPITQQNVSDDGIPPSHMDVEEEEEMVDDDVSIKSESEVEEDVSEEEEITVKAEEPEVDTDEESDDESRGMWLPEGVIEPAKPNVITNYSSVQKLVRSVEDLETLNALLAQIGINESEMLDENEIQRLFFEDFKPKLKLDENVKWPPATQTLPFRLAPYRNIPDDERRQYLPNLGPGVPNEIVQSYKDRPLYETYEDVEEDESRTDYRALNVSRSAFGVNADLFADDNLSKNAKDTRLARSAIHDWGLYANELIPANEFVIEYVGDVLRDEYAEIRERHYALEGIDSTYLFRLDNGTVIDATKRGNGARFINHSCDPNCTAQVFDYEGFKRVVLFSLREIEPDEELTFDYNFVKSQDEEGRVRCACGAANCRGWLM